MWTFVISTLVSGIVVFLWGAYLGALIGLTMVPLHVIAWVDQIFQILVGGYILIRFGLPIFKKNPPFIQKIDHPICIAPWEIQIVRAGGLFIMSKYFALLSPSPALLQLFRFAFA